MPIIAKKPEHDAVVREPVPSGTHLARCYQLIHIGTITSEYQGRETHRDRIRIRFELPNELRDFASEMKPMVISEEYTLSLADSSTLKPLLENWRGKEFTAEELDAFDIEKLLGVPALITVVHNKSNDGKKTYAYIGSITAPVKGMETPPQVNPSFSLSYDNWNQGFFDNLPDFIKEKMMSTPEYRSLKGEIQIDSSQDEPSPLNEEGEIDIMDIPF